MNGISFLDEDANFVAVVSKGEEGQLPGCPVVPSEEGFNFADVVLAVGGRCHDSVKRRQLVNLAKKKDLPEVGTKDYRPPKPVGT